MARLRPNVVVNRASPNKSARASGVPLNLIVVHDTESHNRPGNSDLAAIGSWFAQPRAQASSHVCTDGDGNSARYVSDHAKAWHCAAYNSASLGIEQIGFASDSANTWAARDRQVRETARWIAVWSIAYGIPIRLGAVSGGKVTRAGVVTHAMLGAAGGGHTDPGKGFPMTLCLRYAASYKRRLLAGTPSKKPKAKPSSSTRTAKPGRHSAGALPRQIALARKARKAGARYALRIVREAESAGLSVSLAFAMCQQESGFRNVFGHDAVRNPVKSPRGGLLTVTRALYLRYLSYRKRGYGMQGVGITQLTWYVYQDRADALGGCWRVIPQLRIGFGYLAGNVKKYGLRNGVAGYNGSGAKAQRYADSVLALERRWRAALA